MQDMEKTYNPEFEKRIYDMWMKGKFFEAHPNAEKEPFTVMMPPPNITGQLHMGHALDETIQDVIVRFKRMSGYETLWMPGTDHVHCHRSQSGGEDAQRRRLVQKRCRQRRIFGARVGVEKPIRRKNRRATKSTRHLLRLVKIRFHNGRKLLKRRA